MPPATPPRTTTLELAVGGRSYRFAVPEAEAPRLTGLAARVDAVFHEIKQTEPHIDRDRQLVIACLQLVADLAQHERQLDEQQGAVARFHRHLAERLETLLP